MENELGASLGSFSFMFGGTLTTWFVGLYHPIHLANGILAGYAGYRGRAGMFWPRRIIRRSGRSAPSA